MLRLNDRRNIVTAVEDQRSERVKLHLKGTLSEDASWDPNYRPSGRSERPSAAELLSVTAAAAAPRAKLNSTKPSEKKKKRKERLAACVTFDPGRVAPPTTGTPL